MSLDGGGEDGGSAVDSVEDLILLMPAVLAGLEGGLGSFDLLVHLWGASGR